MGAFLKGGNYIMSSYTYSSSSYTFPGNSGIVLCSTTAVSSGSQSNGILLRYRGTKTKKYYRDASTVVFMGRKAPATEVGQYQFIGVDFEFSFPATNLDVTQTTTVSGDDIEEMLDDIVEDLQAGKFIEYQDSRGRHLIGTLTQDFTIIDEPIGWRKVSGSIVEIA